MKQADFTTKQGLTVFALAFLGMFIGILIGWNTSNDPVRAVSATGIVAVASVILFIVSLIWPEEKHPPPPP
jgi:VIT1/CCC1 family predicted Fe2+/Mn2+ transporter